MLINNHGPFPAATVKSTRTCLRLQAPSGCSERHFSYTITNTELQVLAHFQTRTSLAYKFPAIFSNHSRPTLHHKTAVMFTRQMRSLKEHQVNGCKDIRTPGIKTGLTFTLPCLCSSPTIVQIYTT